ncbi:hypothetical protein BZA70DRAFT_269473 [Myxozyma melibiosi]|uniref:Uncharacterized protein n=1 Tax=Myxozyma melibiosi TaxID=54550 RepID=A0ABR1F047_9ASCO
MWDSATLSKSPYPLKPDFTQRTVIDCPRIGGLSTLRLNRLVVRTLFNDRRLGAPLRRRDLPAHEFQRRVNEDVLNPKKLTRLAALTNHADPVRQDRGAYGPTTQRDRADNGIAVPLSALARYLRMRIVNQSAWFELASLPYLLSHACHNAHAWESAGLIQRMPSARYRLPSENASGTHRLLSGVSTSTTRNGLPQSADPTCCGICYPQRMLPEIRLSSRECYLNHSSHFQMMLPTAV